MPVVNYLTQKLGILLIHSMRVNQLYHTTCMSPETDYHANCICQPRKMRKSFILIVVLFVFIAMTIYLRELLLQLIKVLLQMSSQFYINSNTENT